MSYNRIQISHGNGGKETQQLLQRLIFSRLPLELKRVKGGVGIDHPDDGAVLQDNLVVATDSHTVNPYFFPGGDIGYLAVSGTLNDVIMMGARPIAMLDSIVVSEGFPIDDLERITGSMIELLKRHNVPLVGGDFKVIEETAMRNSIIINTVGLGVVETGSPIVDTVKPGDRIIVTGPVGVHGAVIAAMQYNISTNLKSDVRPLFELLEVFSKFKGHIHAARDPTRGGLAATLNEWAQLTGNVIVIEEAKIPVLEEVKAITEITGLDPLNLASEGVAALAVDGEVEEEVMETLRGLGFEPASIGYVVEPKSERGIVVVRTAVGGAKILEMPTGDIVPRIC
jgi:hydrogenase expression/formation protein HypE